MHLRHYMTLMFHGIRSINQLNEATTKPYAILSIQTRQIYTFSLLCLCLTYLHENISLMCKAIQFCTHLRPLNFLKPQ